MGHKFKAFCFFLCFVSLSKMFVSNSTKGLPTRRSERIKKLSQQPKLDNGDGDREVVDVDIGLSAGSSSIPGECEVPDFLLTQPFHGDSSSDEEAEEAEEAFLEGTYVPKSLLRDRDIGDAPLEMVMETHKRRVVHQRAAKLRDRAAAKQDRTSRYEKRIRKRGDVDDTSPAVPAVKPRLPAQGKRKRRNRKGSGNSRKSAPAAKSNAKKPFMFDFVSGLESDSSDGEELEAISRRCHEQFERISAILKRHSW